MSDPSSDPAANLHTDLTKLTVPQLKALCKEKGVTGYSKLGKAALLQKLGVQGDVQNPAPAPKAAKAPPKAAPKESRDLGSSEVASASLASASAAETPASNLAGSSAALDPPSCANFSASDTAVAFTAISPTLADVASPVVSSQEMQPTGPLHTGSSVAKPSSSQLVAAPVPPSKRPSAAPAEPQRPQKKTKATALPAKARIHADSQPPSASPLAPPVYKVHALPAARTSPVVTESRSPGLSRGTGSAHGHTATPAVSNGSRSLAASGKRFKPLLVDKAKAAATKGAAHTAAATAPKQLHIAQKPAALRYLDFPPTPSSCALPPLTLPPSLSQRKHVQRWAVLLSGLGPAERRSCALVSKTFRHAVYLSAGERLSQGFSGRRLALLRMQHPTASMNMWSYLALREQEKRDRRGLFDASFLSTFYTGFAPIAARLWSSPDHEKQLAVATRFLLTRLWFTVCIGSARPAWLADTVLDAHEVVPGEIWTVTVRRAPALPAESFYVLEGTCEAIGRPQTSSDAAELPVRADWSQYIESRVVPAGQRAALPLLAHLKWASQGEYERGISRHWLDRMAGRGEEGRALRVVAERYVLACVVGNSVSGSWMSAAQMAQEFAGLAERVPGKTRQPQVSMFLPAHHHVESVHFTTAGSTPLHPAIAVIHTLAREYFVLKDNGMQIGCEEDGIADVWQGILGCGESGIEVGPGTIFLAQLVDHVRKSS